jgi:threonine dehydratase
LTSKPLEAPSGPAVDAARENIRGVAIRSPLLKLNGGPSGLNVYLKLENLQPWGSFKLRPALNAIKSLDPGTLGHGVLSASSGNFGQGLAFAAQRLGIPATLVVPERAAQTKVNALIELGANVIRLPFDQWWDVLTSRRCPGEQGVFVHPVAENAVLAGNATIGVEILEDLPDVDAVAVPFGGGGLICGIGSVMRRRRPAVRMVVVESEAAQPAAAALRAGHPVTVPHQQSFVDGMGSSTVLAPMWPLLEQMADAAACVSFAQIADAVRMLAQRHRVIAEAAGAASLAAAMTGQAGKGNIVCIISGGNIDPDKLAAILNGQSPF